MMPLHQSYIIVHLFHYTQLNVFSTLLSRTHLKNVLTFIWIPFYLSLWYLVSIKITVWHIWKTLFSSGISLGWKSMWRSACELLWQFALLRIIRQVSTFEIVYFLRGGVILTTFGLTVVGHIEQLKFIRCLNILK